MSVPGFLKSALLMMMLSIGALAPAADSPAPAAKKGPAMKYGDTSRRGRPFSKDPAVVRFKDKYFLYYSIPPSETAVSGEEWGELSKGVATTVRPGVRACYTRTRSDAPVA